MGQSPKPKTSRFGWFLAGIVFFSAVIAAGAYYIPMFDCPSCDPLRPPEAGEVTSKCTECHARGLMTFWEWLQYSDVRMESPLKIGK